MGRKLEARQQEREQLKKKLLEEGRDDLASHLQRCEETFFMQCAQCGMLQSQVVERRCRRRWCPVCQSQLAAKKSMRVMAAHRAMQWPLFLTLTMPNTTSPEGLKILSRSFTGFRRTKWWKARKVKGGVACFEVTNKGNGWHPHLHALVDCRWLASTPEPSRKASQRENKRRSLEAADELSRQWGAYLGMSSGAVVWTKRAADEGVAQEIAKYAVKGNDLLEMAEPIGPLLDVIGEMRMMTTWGNVRPLGPLLQALEDELDDGYEGCSCESCGTVGSVLPQFVVDMQMR